MKENKTLKLALGFHFLQNTSSCLCPHSPPYSKLLAEPQVCPSYEVSPSTPDSFWCSYPLTPTPTLVLELPPLCLARLELSEVS